MPLLTPPPIESERLLVRPIQASDLVDLFEVNSNEHVTQFLPYKTWTSIGDAHSWLTRVSGLEASGLAIQFVVVLKSANRTIGTCLLFRFEEGSSRAELGYVLGQRHWGQGLMREALSGVIGTAFTSMGLRRLEAEVDARNGSSAGLMTRLGFTKEGLLRQRWVAKGEPRDMEMYGLLRSEWHA